MQHALLGVKALHEQGWLHGDLKPPNIGVIGTPPRAVLLDVGHATHFKLGTTLNPTPGRGGTLDYIAPEREMECYHHAVDVWSLGVIAFELTYGRHPWRFARNPWRNDKKDCENLRPEFGKRYDEATDILTWDASRAEPSEQHIQRELRSKHSG
jgi:serine/threonine protein kinase